MNVAPRLRDMSSTKNFFHSCIWFGKNDSKLSTYIRMCSIVIFIYNCQQQRERREQHTYRAWKKNTQKTHFRKKKEFFVYTNVEREGKCEMEERKNFHPHNSTPQQSKSTFYIKFSFTYTQNIYFIFSQFSSSSDSLSLVCSRHDGSCA